jgi:imidazoleglycerol phosphate dehydratase HisB
MTNDRVATITRRTNETQIELTLNLDGSGQAGIETGVGFFDHMLHHVAVHGLFDLTVQAAGDLEIDAHHTVEDVAIAFGRALHEALGDRVGIARMGAATVPMDEALARVVVDLSGRAYPVFNAHLAGAARLRVDCHLGAAQLARPGLLRLRRPPQGRGVVQGAGPRPARGGGSRSTPGGGAQHERHAHGVAALDGAGH